MRYIVIAILLMSITLSACKITGDALEVVIDPDNPGIYIDGPDRVNINSTHTPIIELSIIAATYENISGFQLEMSYPNNVNFAPPSIPGGVFGTQENGTYFCMEPIDTGSTIDQLACVALPGSSYYPNTDGYGHLYNLSFIPTSSGTATFNIDTTDSINGPNVLADSNGDKIQLVTGTAFKNVLVCVDADSDGEYNSGQCNPGGVVDCRDDLDYVNTGHTEWCNGFDNDCDGTITDSVDCASQTPIIDSITGNGNSLYDGTAADPNPVLAGDINFVVDVTDSSLSNDGVSTGSNVDRVDFYVNNNLVGTDNVNGKTTYQMTYDSSVLQDDTTHTLRVVVTDSLNSLIAPVEISRSFTVNNNVVCEIQSIDWGQNSVNDGGSISLTVVGSQECLGKEYTLSSGAVSYLECDGTSCETVPTNVSNALPGNTISFVGSTTFTESGFANWFLDIGGSDPNPEIKVVINDDTDVDKESGILEVVNTAPTIEDQGNTPGLDTARVYMTVSENSRFTLDWGTQPGVYTNQQISATLTKSHEFTINGLEPRTTYYYRITAVDQGGLNVSTGELSFETVTYETDFNDDGAVDLYDLWEVVVYFRVEDDTGSASDLWDTDSVDRFDLNNDGVINILDLTLLVRTFTG